MGGFKTIIIDGDKYDHKFVKIAVTNHSDLLEACKAMLGLDGYDKTIGELMAVQAIAKAEGK